MLELATLQEEVEAAPYEVARATIIRELGKAPEELFAEFNHVPLAAASLSQAYKAVLADGRDVVVKVQRPNLTQIITQDVETLGAIADEVMNYPSMCRHTDWPSVIFVKGVTQTRSAIISGETIAFSFLVLSGK
jgi:ubiquinone biosynthesis protein